MQPGERDLQFLWLGQEAGRFWAESLNMPKWVCEDRKSSRQVAQQLLTLKLLPQAHLPHYRR